ncbi:class I SAM-dependent methyltransferase [Actinoplanes derwentensis]|uniref:Methyltransferase domain-containing protein n=1 Tax=Actinoplanes derwentensis TaxID=113562 RepID=A0A1H2B4I0_9ACTN|nr:class I SAM-dependent methyltransferase [Actinoplanes derwentensis]SDT52992.1 Methyltransferase domain-containing protein [Actinoplanes derwentensis]
MPSTNLDAAYFDAWYADMAGSPARDAVITGALGLPPELRDAGTLTWQGIAEVAAELQLPEGGLLLDMACGRGGYGIEIARRAGARLVGVDISAVALSVAEATGGERLPGRAVFQTGTLTASGLAGGSVDGLMCLDAVQFAEPPLAAMAEFRRLLVPGGRLALTCWEATEPDDAQVPARIRAVDLRRDLVAAGFAEVEVWEKPQWRAAERALWEAAMVADGSDPAVRAMQVEGRRSLDTFGSLRRVFATATAPAPE